MRLPAPVANNSGAPNPPLGMVIDEVGLNSMSPPFNASTSGWPKPFGQLRVTPLAMIVASSAIMAMAPPPVFPTTIPLAAIVAPLMASSAILAAFTGPFAVTMELVSAQTPVPPPLATMAPFVVTSALFCATRPRCRNWRTRHRAFASRC